MPLLKKLMLVENEEDIREAARLCLKDLGDFDIVMCESGQQALNEYEAANPQLILLDVMMPGMNGLITFEKLKTLPCWKSVPVVFMTARAHTNQIDGYMKSGAAGVIAKPFDPLTIIKELNTIWEKITS